MPANVSPSTDEVTLDRERDRPHPLQIELYRRATVAEKLAAIARLNSTLLELKDASLQARFPHQSATERRSALRRWWLTARD